MNSISEFYRWSSLKDKLQIVLRTLIKNESIKLSLCNKGLYNEKRILLMTSMLNYIYCLSDVIGKYQINKSLEYVNEYLVSPFGQNLMNYPNKTDDEVINMTVQECTSVKLEQILSCYDFIDVFNSPEIDTKNQLQDLLSKHTEMSYKDIKTAVEVSLIPEDQKIFFAKVLPAYNFKVCNDFDSTWDMFKNGYIDFDTLVTKFWDRESFDQGQNNKDQQNVFRDFARKYTKYAGYNTDNMGDSKSSTENMISGLRQKGVIGYDDTQNLKNQIGKATNVTIWGVIIQFLSNLFSKDKTAFKPIQQIKQDRVISNLKPLSGILRRAAGRNKEGNDKLI